MKSIACVALAILAIAGFTAASQVKLTVYYESLCPDSRRFIINQLYPTLTLLGGVENEYLQPEFVPYGKATTNFTNGEFTFECQHGNNECLGNKVHACALAKLSKEESAALINCMMDNFDAPDDAELCAANLNIDYTPVKACYDSWEGPTLLAANGIKTHDLKPTLYYVPWITYDDVWTVGDMTGSEQNLLGVLCEKLASGNPPPQCDSIVKK